jgi:two-component system, OmpR family, phosphate regulon sensor histidine kinase PhoR
MRWWLGLSFALIAALTALAVAEVFTQRAEEAFRERAQELAAGNAIAAASAVGAALPEGTLERTLVSQAQARRLALFVFDDKGQPLTPLSSRRVDFGASPIHAEALERALEGRRFVDSTPDGRTIAIGLPLRVPGAAALVAVASRPELVSELGILRDKIVEAALWAVVLGATAGLVVATLIARRLRRIARAAAEIEAGNFETELRPRFHDELGELASTVDRMRQRLRESFTSLEAERNRLRRLLERLHEGVVAVDPSLDVLFANRVAARMLGEGTLRQGDPLPEPWPELFLRRVAAGLFAPGADLVEARATAGDRSYSIVGIPPGRGTDTAVLVLTDISERERRERAEREFVANAAHELRTPLTAIASAVDALNSGAKNESTERDRFLGVIERQATRLGRLVRTLLVLARAQTRQEPIALEPIEVRSLLEEVAAGLTVAEDVSVEIDCPPRLGVLAQRDLLEQALTNIASNAAKHTFSGRIVLAATASEDEFVAIEVRDTGSGIGPEAQERIFDRFWSSDEGDRAGFGLGLAIVREAVRALGGVIEVDSRPGIGTTVRVVLAGVRQRAA